jgi:alpha-L-fucosidase
MKNCDIIRDSHLERRAGCRKYTFWFLALSMVLSPFNSAVSFADAWEDAIADSTAAHLTRPDANQFAWHEQERLMFIHFGVATWEGTEYDGDGKTDLSKMNPEGFDADRICEVAESWGAREIVLVCKHVGGFCWWQTETTDYSVKNIPWKNGHGDLVKDVADACRRHGLAMGIYIYSDDPRYTSGIGRGGRADDPGKQEEWNGLLRQQWEEVLTLVGGDIIREVWFDGSCIVPLDDIISRLAPNAVIFQGPQASIRWVGNEAGIARDPDWNTLSKADVKSGVATQEHSSPDGDAWAAVECDVTLYNHNWFWNSANEGKRRSVDELMSIYLQSAGRGSVLLLNSTPNTDGKIPEGDQEIYQAFGKAIDANFSAPLGKIEKGTGSEVVISLDEEHLINCVDLWEAYQYGHRIRRYAIDALVDGTWKQVSGGTAVGRRKIDLFEPVEATKIRIRVLKQVGTPLFRQVLAHKVDPGMLEMLKRGTHGDGWIDLKVTPSLFGSDGSFDVDLSDYVVMPGQYEVRIEGTRLKSALPFFEGQPGDAHFLEKIDTHTYRINRTQAIDKASSTGIRIAPKHVDLEKFSVSIRPVR